MLRQTSGVVDVPCPKCEVASGTRCIYVYGYVHSKYKKAWRERRNGKTMEMFHAERYRLFRDIDAPDPRLPGWLAEHGHIFKE